MNLVDELRALLDLAEAESNYLAKQKIMAKIRDKVDEVDLRLKDLEGEELYSVWD
jgi:hypothetical protein